MSVFGLWAINLTNRCMKLTLVLLKMKSFSLFGFPGEPVVFHLPYPFLNLSVVFQQILNLSVIFIERVSITFLFFFKSVVCVFKSVVCGIFEGCLKDSQV